MNSGEDEASLLRTHASESRSFDKLTTAPGHAVLHPHDGVLGTLRTLLEIVVISIFVVTFLLQPSRIPSESMEPTLKVGDFLLVDKQSYAPGGMLDKLLPPERVERGDLVIFHWTGNSSIGPPGIELVKRVIGLPGDRLRLRGGRVLLNGTDLTEPYAFYSESRPNHFRDDFPSLHEADPNVDPRWWIELRRSVVDGEIVVPQGQYFVLGDNRNNSEDSRYWGFVSRNAMVGRPLVVDFAVRPEAEQGSIFHRLATAVRESWQSVRVVR